MNYDDTIFIAEENSAKLPVGLCSNAKDQGHCTRDGVSCEHSPEVCEHSPKKGRGCQNMDCQQVYCIYYTGTCICIFIQIHVLV